MQVLLCYLPCNMPFKITRPNDNLWTTVCRQLHWSYASPPLWPHNRNLIKVYSTWPTFFSLWTQKLLLTSYWLCERRWRWGSSNRGRDVATQTGNFWGSWQHKPPEWNEKMRIFSYWVIYHPKNHLNLVKTSFIQHISWKNIPAIKVTYYLRKAAT